ncbi:hypothetical protein SAMN05443574_11853 [Haloarcula vallismortis]|uniref:Uncharacterized protein n=2 Tax=Haloarcula vallismortis TaxID=28442 RepID=M0JLD7_HALVA|nr:hypothetical protein [Haloarcula vallismortis]EMA09143.1 hypothetical protein C437_07518 [Haloarcula vallismortis ATCC 29715]SDX20753.1 hypothetical protein SAMN05443574_11853 [Haloarcula vallismortis]
MKRRDLFDIYSALLFEAINELLTCEALSIMKDHEDILDIEHFMTAEHVHMIVMNWKHPRDKTAAMAKQEEANSGTEWSFIAALMAAA